MQMNHLRRLLERRIPRGHLRDPRYRRGAPGSSFGTSSPVTRSQEPFDHILGKMAKGDWGISFLVLLLTSSIAIFLFHLFCSKKFKEVGSCNGHWPECAGRQISTLFIILSLRPLKCTWLFCVWFSVILMQSDLVQKT